MPTFRAFAYNTGSTISGTEQVGSIAIGTTTIGGNVVWWAGPDEDLGYVVAQSVSGGTMTGADGRQAFLGFYRTSDFTNQSFITLAEYLSSGSQNFSTGEEAKTWLNNNGYWTSYVFLGDQIDSGEYNGAFISDKGLIFTWGLNTLGKNGNNSTADSITPNPICGATKTFCKVTVGGSSTIALDKYGRLWGWGSGSGGQLGRNSTTNFSTPVSVCGAVKTFCDISGGGAAYGLDKYGQVWSWGFNQVGQLGNNSLTSYSTPVAICGVNKTFCVISADSGRQALAIDKYGRLWGWGYNGQGQLGNNSATNSFLTPVSVAGVVKTFCKVSSGYFSTLGLDKYGQVWSWGFDVHGNNMGANTYRTPVSICGAKKTFCQISAALNIRGGIDKYGQIWMWGAGSSVTYGGLLGNNIYCNNTVTTPMSICGAKKTFCNIYVGDYTALAVDNYGQVWSWGSNQSGAMGINVTTIVCSPRSICGNTKTFCNIDGYDSSIIVSDKNGKLWGWGANGQGQIGTNNIISRFTPVSVLGTNKTFCKVSSGLNFSLAIDFGGRLWAWGINQQGQLGRNNTTNFLTPASICGAVKTFCVISGTEGTSYGIDKYGRVWSWGSATSGKLGDNQISTARSTPISVCGAVKTFCKISGVNQLSIDKNGLIWGWGVGTVGKLGRNSTTNFSTPVSICGALKTFCDVNGGTFNGIGLTYDGKIWAWGSNLNGLLGINSTTSVSTPRSICGAVKTFCKISGFDHNLAIDIYGRIWSWGLNTSGQLGDGTQINRSTPVRVCAQNKTFCDILATSTNSFAVDKNGQVWSWGLINISGTLGINQVNYVPTPVKVFGF